jgi:hypothetical protein
LAELHAQTRSCLAFDHDSPNEITV